MASHSSNNSKRRKTAHGTCPRELALFDADLLASVVPYLAVADMTSLSLTCRHFGAVSQRGNCDEGDASLSLVQEAARRAILNEQSAAEKAALVRYPGESWIELYHQLLMLRAPLIFDMLFGNNLEYDDEDKSRVIVSQEEQGVEVWRNRSAISNHVMRGGKHYAEFSLVRGLIPLAGIMRPIPNPISSELERLDYFHPALLRDEVQLETLKGSSERWGTSDIDCCLYSFYSRQCICRDWRKSDAITGCGDWEGREGFERHGSENGGYTYTGVLGLLLDLDAGTLTAYKNGRRLYVMCEGLTGEYCWVASIVGKSGISIERGAIPYDA